MISVDQDVIGIYTDLDTLMDTRLATLHRIDPSKVENVLPMYFSRISDEFPGYNTEEFKLAYAARNEETLQHAMLTEATQILKFFAGKTLAARIGTPFRKQPKVTINMYPYVLPIETQNILITAINYHCKGMLDIELIYRHPEEVTPEYIRGEFAMMAMYDYCSWLDLHTENGNFRRHRIPSIKLMVPNLLKSVEAAEMFKDVKIFEIIQNTLSPIVSLEFNHVSKFCIDHNLLAKFTQQDN